jgi:hypothetical protein
VAEATVVLHPGEYLAYDFAPTASWTVSFTAAGLPMFTTWTVVLDGVSHSSSGSTINFTATNGTHNFTVDPIAGYAPNVSRGSFVMAGANRSFVLTWSQVTYAILASESGLAAGLPWGLTVNGADHTGPGPSLSFRLPNGTYAYTVDAVAGYRATVSRSSIVVAGAGVNLSLTFTGVPYAVTFQESGLPDGSMWFVNVSGHNYSGSGPTIGASLPNASYPYTVWAPVPYLPSPGAGSLSVTGAPLTIAVAFAPVPATLVGAVLPRTAELWVNGSLVALHAGNYTLTLPPGTYAVRVTAPGYAPLFLNVTIGAGQELSRNFTLRPSPNGGSGSDPAAMLLSPLGLLLLVGIGAAVAVAAVAYATRGRRRR